MTIFLLCMRPFLYPIPLSEFKSVHLGIYKIGFYRSQVYSYYKKNSHFSCSSLSSSFSPLPPRSGTPRVKSGFRVWAWLSTVVRTAAYSASTSPCRPPSSPSTAGGTNSSSRLHPETQKTFPSLSWETKSTWKIER